MPWLVGLWLGAEIPELVRFPMPLPWCSRTCLARNAAGSRKRAVGRLGLADSGSMAGQQALHPRRKAVVAAGARSPRQCGPVRYGPSEARGEAPHLSLSALGLTRSTVGTTLVRMGQGGGREGFGWQVLDMVQVGGKPCAPLPCVIPYEAIVAATH